jgi:predicted RNA polymerase sigma factor
LLAARRAITAQQALQPDASCEVALDHGLAPARPCGHGAPAYHLLPAVRGDLLRKLGRSEEARVEFERAASLTQNVPERELLRRRAAECAAEWMAG